MVALISSKVWFLFIALTQELITLPHSSGRCWLPNNGFVEICGLSLERLWTLLPKCCLNMAENLIVRLQVTIDSVRGLLDSLDRGEPGNTARILVLESLVIQIRTLLSRWELLAIIAASCTSICPIRGLPTVSHGCRGVNRPRNEIFLPQLEFPRNTMRFTWYQITAMLLVSRTTLWRRVFRIWSHSLTVIPPSQMRN